MKEQILNFMLSLFASWRITHLLSHEDGPFDVIYLLRKQLGQSFFGSLLDCFYCLSIWVTLPFGLWMGRDAVEKFLCWFALSGAACVLQKAISKKDGYPSNL